MRILIALLFFTQLNGMKQAQEQKKASKRVHFAKEAPQRPAAQEFFKRFEREKVRFEAFEQLLRQAKMSMATQTDSHTYQDQESQTEIPDEREYAHHEENTH